MKKVLGSLAMVLLMVFMFSGFASAAELSSDNIVLLVEQTNTQINQDIKDAQSKADRLTNIYQQAKKALETTLKLLPRNTQAYDTNMKLIELAGIRYDEDLDKIIEDLVNTTNTRALETKQIAAENGYTVICEMVEVVVGDKTVLIDPLRVVGI
jgi:hypothetical protein